MKVLGYFVEKDGKEIVQDICVIIDTGDKKLTIYTPTEQHSEVDRDYLDVCTPIIKERYKELSKNFYTPKEYL